jgi:hypothetical protein
MNTVGFEVGHDLPPPSRHVATCAWCRRRFDSIVELLIHVDANHLASVAEDFRVSPHGIGLMARTKRSPA